MIRYFRYMTTKNNNGDTMNEVLNYIEYPENVEKYDTSKPPIRQKKLYKNLVYFLSNVFLSVIRAGYTIEKINMEGLKPPYILLSNHMQIMDFCVSFKAVHPYRISNIATLDGYVGMVGIMENLGSICKRKFTTDLSLVRSCRKVLHEYGDVLCMYPEARYSPIGTLSIIPDAVGKLVKSNKVPLVIMVHHGNYLNAPFWDFRQYRKVPFYATMKQVLTAEEVQQKSADEINEIIRKEMEYDEHRWQKENNIRITESFRAEGLHKVLYQCPHCKTESKMNSQGIHLFCEECGKKWEMTELGEMKALEGETEFSHIPDWFEWERTNVRQQILDGTYKFEDDVHVQSLPGVEFIDLGEGKITHDFENGFVLTGHYNGHDYRIQRNPKDMYSLHVEYAYKKLGKIDCFDVSVKDDSFYCIPTKKDVVTKLGFATEEMFKIITEKRASKV